MTRGMRILLAASMFALSTASAQSTTRVGHYERPVQLDASIGTSFPSQGNYCCEGGPMHLASIGVRWDPSGHGAFRAGLLGLDRTTRYSFDVNNANQVDRHERLLVVTAAADASFRVVGDLAVAVAAGAGFAPYVHGSQVNSSSQGYPASYDRTTRALLWTGSVSARYRWFFVEQHVLILNGANSVILENREFFPIAVGVRF